MMIKEWKGGGRFLLTLFSLTLVLVISSNGLSAQQTSSCTIWIQSGESIQETIDQAPEGTVICLDAGVWKENLKIEKSLTLRGVGSGQTTIEGSKAGYPVVWVTNNVSSEEVSEGELTLSGLSIISAEGKELTIGDEEPSKPVSILVDIDGVTITGARGQCVEPLNDICSCGVLMQDAARVEISNSVISANEGSGVWLTDSSQGKINYCTVSHNGWKDVGIWLQDSTQVSVSNSTISENGGGIYLNDSAQATITGSTVFWNNNHGVLAQSSSQVEIASSGISGNGGEGISLWDSAKGTITRCVVSRNRNSICLGDSAEANITGCIVSSGDKQVGVLLKDSSHAGIATCAISNNWIGIEVLGSAQANIASSTVSQNGGGIVFEESSQGSINDCAISENEIGVAFGRAAQATVIGNSITNNERYGVVIAQQPCIDTDEVFSGHILGEGNSIPGPYERNGNLEAGVCPEWLDYLTEPCVDSSLSGQADSLMDHSDFLFSFSLEGYKTSEEAQSILSILAHQLQEHPSLYLEIWYDHPGKLNREADYSVVEAIYRFLLDQGLYGRIVTTHREDVDADKPQIFIVRREHSIAADSVPTEVIEVVEQFLTACVRRDQSAVELFSSHVRETFTDEELQSFISGTSNPHHCGYFIHSITPYRDGWTVVVSLFDHYTGYNLDLAPEKSQRAFYIIREGERYAIDSLPCAEEEITRLVQGGMVYSLHLSKHYSWGSCALPRWHTFSIYAGNKLLYRFGSVRLSVERIEDVTGDGLKEIVVCGDTGGNHVVTIIFVILKLSDSQVTKIWPPGDPLITHYDVGYGGKLRDLDGDGIPELLTTDARFECWGPLCCACSPYEPMVYSWEQDHYRYASPQFPEVYRKDLQEIAAIEPEDILSTSAPVDPGTLFSSLIRLLLCYEHMGLKKEGWEELERLVRKWDFERIWDAYAIGHEESPLHVCLDDLHEEFFSAARSPD